MQMVKKKEKAKEAEPEAEKEELPPYYIQGARMEAELDWYKWQKKKAIETLQHLSYQISNIEGKQEEVRRCVYGDMRLAVTFIEFPTFLLSELVLNEEDIKLIKNHVTWYNNKVKEEQYVNAGVALSDLKAILIELRDKKAKLLHIDMETIEKKAHTPIVIKAKKRINEH